MLERYEPTLATEPFEGIRTIRSRINRLFSELFPEFERTEQWFYPAYDMIDTRDELMVQVELPGVGKNDFKLTVNNDILSISGDKKMAELPEGANRLRNEISYGNFARQIRLPYPVDADKIKAELRNGILTVHLPKREEVRPKEIPVS
jgi:HSP20 family protein